MSEHIKADQRSEPTIEDKVQALVGVFGHSPENPVLAPKLIERAMRLEKHTGFNQDSRLIMKAVWVVMEQLALEWPGQEGRDILGATHEEMMQAVALHDIGKSGPADAGPKTQMAVIMLFRKQEILPSDLIGDVIAEKFSRVSDEELEIFRESGFGQDLVREILEALAEAGITPDMTMRQFYNKHSEWTKELLEESPQGISPRVRILSASHHVYRGVYPYTPEEMAKHQVSIPASSIIGLSEECLSPIEVAGIEEKVMMVVDTYEAHFHRRRIGHENAMRMTTATLTDYFKNDPVLNKIIEIINRLGAEGKLFPELEE
ncbi:MAG TPA: hypothetical protein VJL32_03300 [Candidatus Paceibacterota bacterium]